MKISHLAPNFGKVIASVVQGLWNKISSSWNTISVTWDKW